MPHASHSSDSDQAPRRKQTPDVTCTSFSMSGTECVEHDGEGAIVGDKRCIKSGSSCEKSPVLDHVKEGAEPLAMPLAFQISSMRPLCSGVVDRLFPLIPLDNPLQVVPIEQVLSALSAKRLERNDHADVVHIGTGGDACSALVEEPVGHELPDEEMFCRIFNASALQAIVEW